MRHSPPALPPTLQVPDILLGPSSAITQADMGSVGGRGPGDWGKGWQESWAHFLHRPLGLFLSSLLPSPAEELLEALIPGKHFPNSLSWGLLTPFSKKGTGLRTVWHDTGMVPALQEPTGQDGNKKTTPWKQVT